MAAVAVHTDCDPIITLFRQGLPVNTRQVSPELIGVQSVGIHALYVRMARSTKNGNIPPSRLTRERRSMIECDCVSPADRRVTSIARGGLIQFVVLLLLSRHLVPGLTTVALLAVEL